MLQAEQLVGIENLNTYNDPTLKRARLQRLEVQAGATARQWRYEQLQDDPSHPQPPLRLKGFKEVGSMENPPTNPVVELTRSQI